jgi:hypothetical protein
MPLAIVLQQQIASSCYEAPITSVSFDGSEPVMFREMVDSHDFKSILLSAPMQGNTGDGWFKGPFLDSPDNSRILMTAVRFQFCFLVRVPESGTSTRPHPYS